LQWSHTTPRLSALTYDDVLLVPNYSNVLTKWVLNQISRNITLNVPIVSAAMDTVTESAINCYEEGGIGVLHKKHDDWTSCKSSEK
jgi:IMP dehydrogenase